MAHAPSGPPVGFAAPRAVATLSPAQPDASATEAPAEEPDRFDQPEQPGLPLAEIEPAASDQRDPAAPFESARIAASTDEPFDPTKPLGSYGEHAASTGSGSAWGAASARRSSLEVGGRSFPPPAGQPYAPPVGDPYGQPTGTTAPAPGTPEQASTGRYAPPAPTQGQPTGPAQGQTTGSARGQPTGRVLNFQPPAAAERRGGMSPIPPTGPLSLGQAVRAAGYPMLGALAAAAFFTDVNIYLLLVAWLLSGQVQREAKLVRQVMSGVVLVRLIISFAPLVTTILPWNAADLFTTWACVAMLLGIPAFVYFRSRRGVGHRE